jgi:hypothetical protein
MVMSSPSYFLSRVRFQTRIHFPETGEHSKTQVAPEAIGQLRKRERFINEALSSLVLSFTPMPP